MTAPTVTFFGTGSNLLFSLGVAKSLKEQYRLGNATAITSSGGAIAAVAFLTLPVEEFDELAKHVSRLMADLKQTSFAWFKVHSVYRKILSLVVKPETLPKLRTHLQIATTRLPFLQVHSYTGPFETVDEVISHLEASAYNPLYFPRLPSKSHFWDLDAGVSLNPLNFTSSVNISPRYKPGIDIFLDKSKVDVLRLRTYQEYLDLYSEGIKAGYEQSQSVRVKISASEIFYPILR